MLVAKRAINHCTTLLPRRLQGPSFSTSVNACAPRPHPTKPIPINQSIHIKATPFENGNRWSFTVGNTAISLAILLSATCLMGMQDSNPLQAEPKQQNQSSTAKTKTTKYQKDEVSLLCLIGFPKSGKTTQAIKIEKRWGKEGWKAIKNVKDMDQLKQAIEKERQKNDGKRISLIVDGFPKDWEQAQKIEKELCEIFCFAYFHMEQEEWTKRTGESKEEYEKVENELKQVRENPREKGNILEIVAGWQKDEVWEMVEAKVEQVIELREMGEM